MGVYLEMPRGALITRDTYDESKNYKAVIIQRGKPIFDSEQNEQQDILYHIMRRFAAHFGNLFFDNAFLIKESTTNNVNNFTFTVGECFAKGVYYLGSGDIEYDSQTGLPEILRKFFWGDVITVPELTTPVAERHDLVVLNMVFKEVTPAEDPDLIDPTYNRETSQRWQVRYGITVLEDFTGNPDLCADEFDYYNDTFCFRAPLAWIHREAANPNIEQDMIVDLREITIGALESIKDYILSIAGGGGGGGVGVPYGFVDFWDATSGIPTSPLEGEMYVCSVAGSGWILNNVYLYQALTGWTEFTAREGMTLRNQDDNLTYQFDGTNWIVFQDILDVDKVDGKDVNDTLETDAVLWTAAKIIDYLRAYVRGLDPQNSVIDFWDASSGLPSGPSIGNRYICSVAGNGWTLHYIYEWNGTSWIETIPNEGYYLANETDNTQYIFNGSAWVKSLTLGDHQDLQNILGADETDTDVVKNKHVCNNQLKDIWDEIDGIVMGGVEINNTDTAMEDIDQFDPVFLNDEGYWKSLLDEVQPLSYGPAAGVASGQGCTYLGDGYIVVVCGNSSTGYGAARICRYINGALSNISASTQFGTSSFTPSNSGEIDVINLGNNRFAICWYSITTLENYITVGQFDGVDTISWLVAAKDVEPAVTSQVQRGSICRISDDVFAVVFQDASSFDLRTKVGVYASSDITWVPSSSIIAKAGVNFPDFYAVYLGNGNYAIVYTDTGGTNEIKVAYYSGSDVYMVTPSAVSFSTDTGISNRCQSVTMGSNYIVTAWSTSTSRIRITVAKFLTTTVEILQKDVLIDIDNDSHVTIQYLGNNYLFVGYQSGTGTTAISYAILKINDESIDIIRQASDGSFGTDLAYSANSCLAGRGIIAMVYYNNDDSTADVVMVKYPAYSGLAKETQTRGNSVTAQHQGLLTMSGLKKGSKYYVDIIAGEISEFNFGGLQIIGDALDTDKLLLK